MSFIDLMGNTTYTPGQISKRLHNLERGRYTVRDEVVLNRIASGIALGVYAPTAEEMQEINDFNTFMGGMVLEAASSRADNELLVATLGYEAAITRLEKYILLEGRTEQLHVPATYDEFGVELTEEVPFIAGIDPLPEFVDVTTYDEAGVATTETVRNPEVVVDETERATAQLVLGEAGPDVIDLAALRKS